MEITKWFYEQIFLQALQSKVAGFIFCFPNPNKMIDAQLT